MMHDDRTVRCPRCGAAPERPCRTSGGNFVAGESHSERRAAMGRPVGIERRRANEAARARR